MSMDRNNDMLIEKSDNSQNDYIKNINYFHKLVKYSREIFSESNEIFFEAIDLVVNAIDVQEEALELQDKGKDVQDSYFKWLDEHGYQYECNFDSEICDKLLNKIYNLETKIEELEESGLDLVIEGVNKWKLARKLTNKLIDMEDEYTECMHNIDENCKPNISKGDFESSNIKECNENYNSSQVESEFSDQQDEESSHKFNEDCDIVEDESKYYYECNNREEDKKYYCEDDYDEQWYYKYRINNGITSKGNINTFNGSGNIKKNHRIRRN